MRTKPPGPRSVLKRGILLGVVAAVVANLLLWGVIVLVGLLSGDGRSTTSHAYPYETLIIAVMSTIAVSLFPGAIGGVTNAYVLHRLSSTGKLTRITSIVPGLLIGFLAGFATVPGMYLVSGGIAFMFRYLLTETVALALIAACVAAPFGGWHGWRVGKWLLEAQ